MKIEMIHSKIDQARLQEIAKNNHEIMVKGVVDLNRKIIALGGELHADAEALMLEEGSKQQDLWGFNIRLDRPKDERMEYVSFINIRPNQKNFMMEIQDQTLRERIKIIVDSLVE